MDILKGRKILVTGGGQGLGEAICKTLAADGVHVIAVDVREEGVKKVAEEIKAAGGQACWRLMDVGDEKSVEKVIKDLAEEHGGLDGVINNAGVDYTKTIEDMSHEEWNRVIRVNLTGPCNVSKAIFPYLKKSGKGHIVNIVSTAAKRAWAEASAYHASKWGLLGFSYAMHVEGRKNNIKVTAVIAGGMRTPFLLDRFPDINLDVLQDPKNVAETVKFVLTQSNGSVIPEVMVLPVQETSWP